MTEHDAIDPERLADTLHELAGVRARTLAAVLTNLQAEYRTLLAPLRSEREILSTLRNQPDAETAATERVADIEKLATATANLEAVILDLEALAGLTGAHDPVPPR